jgi:integrase
MAIKIIARTLGKIHTQDDGTFLVKIRGQESKTFQTKEDAARHLEKHGEKRYDVAIWANKKLRWKTFRRKKDAEDYLHRRNVDVNDGTYRAITREKSKATFSDYAEKWRKKYLIPESGLKGSTLSVKQYCLDKHLIGRFGESPLRGITPENVTDFRTDLLKSDLSVEYVKKLLNSLAQIFKDAIDDGYVMISPVRPWKDRRKSKKSSREEGRALTHREAQMLLEEAEGNPELKLMILLGLLGGLRSGEIFALQFSDIDWDKDLIHIRRTLSPRHGKHHKVEEGEPKYILYAPKTDNSIRDVDLSPKLKDALWSRYMEMQMEGKTGLIFQTSKGTPLDPGNIRERWFKKAAERVKDRADKAMDEEMMKKFDGLTPHDLRHTFGSWKIEQGEDVVYVSKQMGHSKPSITFDVYAHLLEKRRPQAALLTDEKLFGKPVKD